VPELSAEPAGVRRPEILLVVEILGGGGFRREWVLPVDRDEFEFGEVAVAVPAAATATFKVCRSNSAEEDSPTRLAKEEVEEEEFWREMAVVGVDGPFAGYSWGWDEGEEEELWVCCVGWRECGCAAFPLTRRLVAVVVVVVALLLCDVVKGLVESAVTNVSSQLLMSFSLAMCIFALVPLAWLGIAPSTIMYPFGSTEVVRDDDGGPARFMLAG